MKHLLSKSKYIRGLQCERALYLDVYRPELARISWETRQKFARGRGFESMYKATFTNGVDVSAELGYRVDLYPERTAALLSQEGEVVVFEAGFMYDEVLVLADVVQKTAEGRLIIHEVKNGTSVSETFRRDVAVQHYVISHCVERIDEFSVVHNDGQDGFVVVNLLEEAEAAMLEIELNVRKFKEVIRGTEPRIEMGAQCDNPYECPYKSYCGGCVSAQLELGF